MKTISPNRKLRIAFIDYVLQPDKPGRSGLSDIVWDMASELVNLGHEAHIIATYKTNVYPDDRVMVHNFKTPPIGYRNIIGQLLILYRASRVARQIQPDIIHAPEYVSTAIFATLKVPTPMVLTVPGNVYQRINVGQENEGWYFSFLKWAAKKSAKKCSRIIAISREMKKWWEWTGSSPQNTPWIPLGVNPKRFYPVTEAKKILGLPEDKFLFLFVGRFSIEKGLLELIDAVKILSEMSNNGKFCFQLIGRGPLKPEIERKIKEIGLEKLIEIHDWVDQGALSSWYSAADVLIMPSRNEPLGKVMLESMMCGTPVIATETEGPRDHIINGENGFLFRAGKTEDLANFLHYAINNKSQIKAMGEYAHQYVYQKFSWENIMTQIIDTVYMPIMNEHLDNQCL